MKASVFTLCQIDDEYIGVGMHKGHIQILKVDHESSQLRSIHTCNHFTGNIFKMIKSSKEGEIAMGTEKGLFFAIWNGIKLQVDDN